MKSKLMIAVVAIVVLAGLAFFLVSMGSPNIAGNWKSAGAEDNGNGTFGIRDFTITAKTWNLVYTLYGDKDLKYPVFALTVEGPYAIGKASKTVAGANDAVFTFSKKFMTLLSADPTTNAMLGLTSLQKDVKTDVSETGVSFIPSVKNYGQEFDLVRVKGNKLFLGARPADGNMGSEDKRPTALGAALVKY
jgi:hypothetical protein